MAFIKGWVPLYGAGKALPIIQVERSDGDGTFDEQTAKWVEFIEEQDLSKFPRAYPYTVRNLEAELAGVDEVSSSYKYKILNKSGSVIGGISDVYTIKAPAGASYAYTITIYGTNVGASLGSLNSRIYNVTIRNDPSLAFEHLRNRVYYAIRYNPYTTSNWDVDLSTIYTNTKGSSSNHAPLATSLNDLEWYTEYDEAIRNTFPENPYSPGGDTGPAGGGGSFGDDRVNDDLRPLIPSGSAENDLVDAGIFTRYLVTNAQLKAFAKELFTDDFSSALLRELIELMFGKVYDALISVMSYPFAVAELPGITLIAGDIHLGSFDTNVVSTGILTKTFSQIDWGNVDINEYWGNFLDYAPHTKIQLFLPWGTGFVDVDPNECMGTYLNVVTNIELSKGTCVHVVSTGKGAILGTYNGFCGSQYPITAVDTSGKAISTVIGAVGAVTSIGASALGKGAAESAYISSANKPTPVGLSFEERLAHQKRVGQAAAVAVAKPYQAISKTSAATAATSSLAAARLPIHFFRNGSFAANAASMMPQKPFLIMTWPDQSVPSQYGSHVGYPSNIYENLGRLRGYTEVGAVHLDGINCTEHEREELMSLLQGGVIL